MRAMQERDHALEEVMKLRNSGKIREARAKLEEAEGLHARVDTLEKKLKPES